MTPIPDDSTLERIRSGQRLIILSILFNLSAIILPLIPNKDVLLFWFYYVVFAFALAIILGITGLLRLAAGLGYSILFRIFFVLVLLFPIANLLMLGLLNEKATKTLKLAGFKVGFFGARRKKLTAAD